MLLLRLFPTTVLFSVMQSFVFNKKKNSSTWSLGYIDQPIKSSYMKIEQLNFVLPLLLGHLQPWTSAPLTGHISSPACHQTVRPGGN